MLLLLHIAMSVAAMVNSHNNPMSWCVLWDFLDIGIKWESLIFSRRDCVYLFIAYCLI